MSVRAALDALALRRRVVVVFVAAVRGALLLEACANGDVYLGRDGEAKCLGDLGEVELVDIVNALERVRPVRLDVRAVAFLGGLV